MLIIGSVHVTSLIIGSVYVMSPRAVTSQTERGVSSSERTRKGLKVALGEVKERMTY